MFFLISYYALTLSLLWYILALLMMTSPNLSLPPNEAHTFDLLLPRICKPRKFTHKKYLSHSTSAHRGFWCESMDPINLHWGSTTLINRCNHLRSPIPWKYLIFKANLSLQNHFLALFSTIENKMFKSLFGRQFSLGLNHAFSKIMFHNVNYFSCFP